MKIKHFFLKGKCREWDRRHIDDKREMNSDSKCGQNEEVYKRSAKYMELYNDCWNPSKLVSAYCNVQIFFRYRNFGLSKLLLIWNISTSFSVDREGRLSCFAFFGSYFFSHQVYRLSYRILHLYNPIVRISC